MKLNTITKKMMKAHPIYNWYSLNRKDLRDSLSDWLSKTSKESIIEGLMSLSWTMQRQWTEAIQLEQELAICYERKTDNKKVFAHMEKLREELKKAKDKCKKRAK